MKNSVLPHVGKLERSFDTFHFGETIKPSAQTTSPRRSDIGVFAFKAEIISDILGGSIADEQVSIESVKKLPVGTNAYSVSRRPIFASRGPLTVWGRRRLSLMTQLGSRDVIELMESGGAVDPASYYFENPVPV